MDLNFDNLKNKAVDVAQCAVQKTKDLAGIAKAKLAIVAEEDKIRKAHLELGKLYYRDYVLGEEMDDAEYLPWCLKITESKAVIEDLQAMVEDLKNACDTCAEETPEDDPEPAAEEAPAETQE